MDQLDYLELLRMTLDIKGKNILEVGGVIPPRVALSSKIKSWTSIDINEKRFENEVHIDNQDNRYKALLMSAEKMDFDDKAFDVIFSVNCFEHISDPKAALKEMYRVLSDDGIIFTKFAPIWSGPVGHHTWVWDGDDVVAFWRPGGVFPDWYHLTKTEDELREYLRDKYKPELSESILTYVYRSNDLNRWVDSQFIDEIDKYNYYSIVNYTMNSKHKPPLNMLAKLKDRYPNVSNYSTLGFYWILSKNRPSVRQYLRAYLANVAAMFKFKVLKIKSHR